MTLLEQVWHALSDDWPYGQPWMPARVNEWVGRRSWDGLVLFRPYCWFHGHHVIPDNCSLPEHRYCVRCDKRRPNAALSTGPLFPKAVR